MSDFKNELSLENVRKKTSDFTLSANFKIEAGERAALIGKSGIGKTTLLRIIAGLEPLLPKKGDTGRIQIGRLGDVTALPPEKRRIGYVFQDAALFPSLNVLGNVIFGLLRHRGASRQEAEAEGLRWQERVGMQKLAHARVGRLSGGEAQRVAFIRALIWKPELILLGEPFSALDPETRGTLRAELVKLHEFHSVPLLLVSHDEGDLSMASTRLELRTTGETERTVLRLD